MAANTGTKRRWPPMGRRILVAGLAFLLMIPAVWLSARAGALAFIDHWVTQERGFGRDWSCRSTATSGFPDRVVYTCSDVALTIAGRSGQVEVRAPKLEITMRLVDPFVIRGRIQGAVSWNGPSSALAGRLDGKLLAFELAWGWRGVNGAIVRAETMTGEVERRGELLRASAGELAVAADWSSGSWLDLSLDISGLESQEISAATGIVDKLSSRLKTRLERLDVLSAPGRDPLHAWPSAGGRLQVAEGTVRQGDLHGQITGYLTLDERRRPAGELSLSARGLEPVLRRVGVNLPAMSLGGALASLLGGRRTSSSSSDPPTLTLPVRLADGRVFVGPIRTPLMVPPLY